MKFGHTVKHDGVIYPAGTDVPEQAPEANKEEPTPEVDKEEPTPETDVPEPEPPKRGRKPKAIE